MEITGKRILLTGAGGFAGSHLAERLLQHGCEVRAFIRYTSQNSRGMLDEALGTSVHDIEVIAGDLRDSHAVHQATKGIDVIFHLGALIAIPYSYVHPQEVFQTNVMGTLNVMQAALEHGVGKVVHTSTSEVYGSALYVPIDEKHPLQAQSPYSASKIGADKIAESFGASYGLPVTTIRPFNMYGPRQSARAIIPTIITQALTSDEVHIGNLDTTRDFTYVADTARAFIKIAESDTASGQVINVGSNAEISIGDLARKIIKLTGRNPSIIQDQNRLRPANSEVARLRANNSLANTLIDWQPQTNLDEGLNKTIDWIAKHLNHYKTKEYVI